MKRYYGHLVIELVDGNTERVGGNRHSVADGVLTVWTETDYGLIENRRYFSLSSVISFRWEDE